MDDAPPPDRPASDRLGDLLGASPATTVARTTSPRPPAFRDAPAFRGDAAFRDDRFDDPDLRRTHAAPLADELALDEVAPLGGRVARLGAFLVDRVLYALALGPGIVAIAGANVSPLNPFGTS
ncbi:MAG TPA: hypothetical protein VF594_07560, partial [Rubricoccaceae bacterium]